MGKIGVHVVGDDSMEKKAILLTCGDSSAYDHQVPAFLFSNCQVYLIDFPGSGKSNGKPLPQKSN